MTWRCWVTGNGQRYEWRSTCGKYRVWRAIVVDEVTKRHLPLFHGWNGRDVGGFKTIKEAMGQAQKGTT